MARRGKWRGQPREGHRFREPPPLPWRPAYVTLVERDAFLRKAEIADLHPVTHALRDIRRAGCRLSRRWRAPLTARRRCQSAGVREPEEAPHRGFRAVLALLPCWMRSTWSRHPRVVGTPSQGAWHPPLTLVANDRRAVHTVMKGAQLHRAAGLAQGAAARPG